MAFEQRDNSGALFKNKDKKPGDKKPDYKGNGMVNGQLVEFAAWLQESKNGVKYMSIKFQPPRQQQQSESMGEYQGEPEQRQVTPPSVYRRPAPAPVRQPEPESPF